MMRIKNLVLLFILSNTINTHCQDYGVFIGANCNFTSLKSDYDISSKSDISPLVSYSLGGSLKTFQKKKINCLVILEYSRIANRTNTVTISDDFGENIPKVKINTVNHKLILDLLGMKRVGKNLLIGSGLSSSCLLVSRLKVGEYEIYDPDNFLMQPYGIKKVEKKIYKNNYYNTFGLSIPVKFVLEKNRLDYFFKLNIDILDKIKGDSYINEFDNTILFGIRYSIKQ